MEEDEYKFAYSEIAHIRCEFEKALTHHKARCPSARHFWLADREGYACTSVEASAKCSKLLEKLRENSRFSLKLRNTGDKLPHNMEMRVQAGGLAGIQLLFVPDRQEKIEDIRALIERAEVEFGSLDTLPYNRIVQSISRFQGRKSRNRS